MSGELQPDRRGLRASYDDREQIAEQLRVAAGDGRITVDELEERLEAALTARTYGDLEKLVADLPAAPGAPGMAPPAPKDLVQLRSRSGHIRRDGPWQVPKRMEVDVRSGHVSLDFTQAIVAHPTLELSVTLRSGHMRLIVPPGVSVDVDSVEMRSGHVRNRAVHQPGAPARLAITVSGSIRSGHLLVSGPRSRRTFWQWLLRRPRPALPR